VERWTVARGQPRRSPAGRHIDPDPAILLWRVPLGSLPRGHQRGTENSPAHRARGVLRSSGQTSSSSSRRRDSRANLEAGRWTYPRALDVGGSSDHRGPGHRSDERPDRVLRRRRGEDPSPDHEPRRNRFLPAPSASHWSCGEPRPGRPMVGSSSPAANQGGSPRLFQVSVETGEAVQGPRRHTRSIPRGPRGGEFLVYSGMDPGTTFPVKAIRPGGASATPCWS
jgi:hypothetical protein